MRILALLLLAGPLLADPAALLREADAAFRKRRWTPARALYEQAYQEAIEAKHRTIAVEASAQVARCYLLTKRANDGRPWLEKAKGLASESDPVGWSRYLSVLGRFYWKEEKLPDATRTFTAMYEFCVKTGQFDRAVDAAHMVAITGTAQEQIAWAKKGIAAAVKGGHEGWLGPLWNNLGVTHQELGDWKSALDCYRNAREYHWRLGTEVNKLAADWAVGMALRETGDVERSMQWLRPVLAWAERLDAEKSDRTHSEWVGLACRELGYAQMDQFKRDKRLERIVEAQKLLKRAHTLLKNANMHQWDPKAWKQLNERIAALKNPK